MFTLTINQRDSRRDGDLVPQLLKDLRHIPARLDFDRSVEDEVQGIVESSHQAVETALIALRTGQWYVGIGVGPINEPLPNLVKDASGHGLVYARRAVDRLRSSKERIPVAVDGPLAALASEAEAVLRLLGHIVQHRSAAEWRVLDLLTVQNAVARGDGARATALLEPMLAAPEARGSRALLLAQAQVALLPGASRAALEASAERLQTRVADQREDASAWGALAQVWERLGQRLRAVRAEAESRAAVGDVNGALDRLRAAQRLGRSASGPDFIEVSVIEARIRELEARRRQLQAEERGES